MTWSPVSPCTGCGRKERWAVRPAPRPEDACPVCGDWMPTWNHLFAFVRSASREDLQKLLDECLIAEATEPADQVSTEQLETFRRYLAVQMEILRTPGGP